MWHFFVLFLKCVYSCTISIYILGKYFVKDISQQKLFPKQILFGNWFQNTPVCKQKKTSVRSMRSWIEIFSPGKFDTHWFNSKRALNNNRETDVLMAFVSKKRTVLAFLFNVVWRLLWETSGFSAIIRSSLYTKSVWIQCFYQMAHYFDGS